MNLKNMERYLRVNLLGPGPRLMEKEFTGPWSHKGWWNIDLNGLTSPRENSNQGHNRSCESVTLCTPCRCSLNVAHTLRLRLPHYRGADKSVARPGMKQARKHVRDARAISTTSRRELSSFFFPARQGAEGNSRHSDKYYLVSFLVGLRTYQHTFRLTHGTVTCVYSTVVDTDSVICEVGTDKLLIIVQRDVALSSLFIILQVHSTCFGCQPHPSSGVHKTVTTASGIGHMFVQLLQTWSRWREVAAQKIWPVP